MSYDGNGNYSPKSPEFPAVAGTLIKAADWNAIITDLAAALSLVLVRDGQAAMTGNLNMGTKKVQNMGDGAAPQDAVTFGQVLTAAIVALKTLTPAADKFPFFDSTTTASMLTIVAAVRTVLASADVATMRTNMGLGDSAVKNTGTVAGTVAAGDHTHAGYQASDALLTAIATLTTAANQLIYTTDVDTVAVTTFTAFARTLLDDVDAATMRTTLGLGSAALLDADTTKAGIAGSIGGTAYKNILGIACPPSLEVLAWDHQGAVNGVPPGFTFSRASTATAFGPDGALYTAAAGELRHEWNALTGEYKGFLLEGQATNLLLYSEDFTNAAWNVQNSCVKTSATRLTWGANGSSAYQGVVTPADELTRCVCMRIKKASTSTLCRMSVSGTGGTNQARGVTLVPQTGVMTSSAPAGTYGAIDLGDSWLLWITLTNNGSNTMLYTIIYVSDNNVSGAYLDITANQIEVGSYPTSYIPTTSAQVTRAADLPYILTSAFPFNAAEGTLYVEFDRVSIAHTGYYPAIISMDNGTPDGNNTIQVYAVPGSGGIQGYNSNGGTIQADIALGTGALAGVFRLAVLAYKANDMAGCINGGSVGTDTSCTIPSLTRLVIGSSQSMHIRHIAYFPRRLSNTELQLLTK